MKKIITLLILGALIITTSAILKLSLGNNAMITMSFVAGVLFLTYGTYILLKQNSVKK